MGLSYAPKTLLMTEGMAMLVPAAFLLLVLGPVGGHGLGAKKPNILHILVDDFGWADGGRHRN